MRENSAAALGLLFSQRGTSQVHYETCVGMQYFSNTLPCLYFEIVYVNVPITKKSLHYIVQLFRMTTAGKNWKTKSIENKTGPIRRPYTQNIGHMILIE